MIGLLLIIPLAVSGMRRATRGLNIGSQAAARRGLTVPRGTSCLLPRKSGVLQTSSSKPITYGEQRSFGWSARKRLQTELESEKEQTNQESLDSKKTDLIERYTEARKKLIGERDKVLEKQKILLSHYDVLYTVREKLGEEIAVLYREILDRLPTAVTSNLERYSILKNVEKIHDLNVQMEIVNQRIEDEFIKPLQNSKLELEKLIKESDAISYNYDKEEKEIEAIKKKFNNEKSFFQKFTDSVGNL